MDTPRQSRSDDVAVQEQLCLDVEIRVDVVGVLKREEEMASARVRDDRDGVNERDVLDEDVLAALAVPEIEAGRISSEIRLSDAGEIGHEKQRGTVRVHSRALAGIRYVDRAP